MPFRDKVVKEPDAKGKMQPVMVTDPETGEIKPLTEPETFLNNFLANTEKEANELYKKFMPTLRLLANNYARYSGLDKEDFIEEGLIGLARASRDFQKDRSSNFNVFAITKIKDAMKEYSSTQATNVIIPQYIRNATQLVHNLHGLLESAGMLGQDFTDYKTIWEQSDKCDEESDIIKEITDIRKSIKNLALRSGTTVDQLLDRAELYPINMPDTDIHSIHNDVSMISNEWHEEEIAAQLTAEKSVNKIKELITEEEFDIIYAHYVDGKTVRDLGPLYNITAPTMTIRIHKILEKIRGKIKSRKSMYE